MHVMMTYFFYCIFLYFFFFVIQHTVKPAQAVTCIKRSPFSYPVIENFIWIKGTKFESTKCMMFMITSFNTENYWCGQSSTYLCLWHDDHNLEMKKSQLIKLNNNNQLLHDFFKICMWWWRTHYTGTCCCFQVCYDWWENLTNFLTCKLHTYHMFFIFVNQHLP
jgi:hypothetical protein